jgi:UDP-glucose 4-epimerase
MRILVTGSAGHLGEGLVRAWREEGLDVVGLDVLPSPWTDVVGSITDRELVRAAMAGAHAVVHAATLHKPHVASHARQAFVDVNVTGTLTLLEAAVDEGVGSFVLTSSTTTFGRALSPPPGAPAAWIDEDVVPVPKNVYGATKVAAEDLCELVHRDHGLPVLVLRTSRFFPETDDVRTDADQLELKVTELLHRRLDLADAVTAHRLAVDRAREAGFARLVVSATPPFARADCPALGRDAAAVVRRRVPEAEAVYAARSWRLPERLDRVYDNARARALLGWEPAWTFRHALARLAAGEDPRSPLALAVGAKGYHAESFGPYTTR